MKNLRKVETCASCGHLTVGTRYGAEPVCKAGDEYDFINDENPCTKSDYTNLVCDDWSQRTNKTCGTCMNFDPETNTCSKDDSGEKIDPDDPHDCEIWVLAGSDEL